MFATIYHLLKNVLGLGEEEEEGARSRVVTNKACNCQEEVEYAVRGLVVLNSLRQSDVATAHNTCPFAASADSQSMMKSGYAMADITIHIRPR